jgi:glycosyltransferase involved in cell wall biosynthesis
MRIAFHAPLKPPDAPTPSGDRRVARLLIAALRTAGHTVEIASRLRTRDGAGSPTRQARLAALGERLAARYVRAVRDGRRARPDLWFTYHLYYKAPDLIGPLVADALAIPYAVAEASVAHKRADGPWESGHRAVLAALARADLVIGLNPRDRILVEPCLGDRAAYLDLKPFLDRIDPVPARPDRPPELLAVGMMRPGDKAASYRVLGAALARVGGEWRLTVAGDGSARAEVEAALAPFGARVRYLGALDPDRLRQAYHEADVLVWPAINEAFGMALLEAQAAGLPVIAGDSGGVSAIVRHGETGLLAPEGDAVAFARAVDAVISQPILRRSMGLRAAENVRRDHTIDTAAARIDAAISPLVAGRRARCG